jgi:hypothetical protein
MPIHPYRGQPAYQFWSTGITKVPATALDPVVSMPFAVSPHEPVAAVGSCIAQHIAHHLKSSGYNFLLAEPPLSPTEPVFSARYGKIYTVRQLCQLLTGAYGLHRPATRVWRRPDGRFIDPLRPQLFPDGFGTADGVINARRDHLLAVRRVFQECRIFVFTLGLTETWLAPDDTVLPVPPGVLGIEPTGGAPRFHNFSIGEMRADMDQFLSDFSAVNPEARVILTVSPVPLVATFEQQHVLVADAYSKAALRVLAEETAGAYKNVAYFPSYEIITAPQIRGAYFESDLSSVTEAGVSHVLRLFTAYMMGTEAGGVLKPRASH